MKYLFLVIFFLGTLFTVKAQVPKFSDDPAVFIGEVQQMMATTRNDNAMNVANLLEMAWNSGNLSQGQKEHIIKFSKGLQAKRYRPRPHFESYYAAIGSAVNVHSFKGAQIDQLLDVIDKTYEKEDPKTVEQFMATTARFLATKALYRTTTNGLRIIGGDFNFEYRYGNEVDEEPVVKKTVPVPAPKPAAKPAPKKAPAKKPAAKPKNNGWDDWSGWEEETETTTKKDDDGWGTIPDNEVKTSTGQELGISRYLTEEMPIMKGPVIVIKNADLAISSQYDSVTIRKTNGVVSLLRNVFVGRGGTFDWEINGNPASAELQKYTFNITRSEFKAEGATLTYPAVLEQPIEGVFEYKAKKRNTVADTGFPRFASFTNDAKLKNLGPDLGYRGGFSLAGARIMSAALDGSFSYLAAKIGDVKKFKASSRSFSLGDTLITSDRAGITLFQEKDSITHPGMGFKFSRGRNLLKMVENNNTAFKHTPFVDSYHKMEITADMLTWKLDQQEINFSIVTAKEQVSAKIESHDYFSNTRYQQLKGISSFHPLQMAVGYGQLKKTDRFYAIDLARSNKIKEIAVKRAMANLARNGYIDYNSTTGFIILKPKAIHYVASHRDKKDFDHISIRSRQGAGKNANLNLDNNILTLRGVEQFSFNADSGAITVRPDSGIVRVKKNRDMDFNGRVITPNFIFKGSDFKFSYNNFWIDMVKIDSLIFRTKKGKKGPKERMDIAGADPAKAAELKKAAEERARYVADSIALVSAPDDFPEDDSVLIRKKLEAKSAKKLAKQKAKEEKKKAKALAKAEKAKKKKPQLDEYGDPIIEDEAYADAEDPEAVEEVKPVVKKPKPTGPTEKALTGLNGKLYLNKPNNKSGRKKIPGYPMFDASTGAVVYFNKPDVLGGAYDSSVYFTIPPFKLDSVGSASQTAVNFKGTFHSGNIFPPIETRLTVMPDQSLGFNYEMPKEGLPLYGGKGKATGNIILNENGLQTKGSISYLSTTLKADTFTYYLDSVATTRGISGMIAANDVFPDATVGHYSMNWHVSENKMALNKPDTLFNKETMDPIKLYKGQFAYSGQAIITPEGLLGNGTVENEETKIKSPLFNFQASHFKGNNAIMEIKSSNPDKPALLATDVQLDYSLKKGSASFAPERAGFASTELPYSQFKTSLSGGNWDFKKKIVTMKEPEAKEDISGSYFYSTNPEQDTLKFNATSGYYDLSNYTLIAGGVPYIVSNDAYIYPADGKVEITENADVKVLSNARIVMDSLDRFHELVKGEIDIMSKKEFQGTATLMYKNSQEKIFPIQFNSFTRDSLKVAKGEPKVYFTKAIGSVFEETKMELLPKILYKGDVFMTSNKQLLDFEGEMRLAFGSEGSSDWFPYKNTVNPDSIRITIKDMKTADGEPLITGLHVSNGSSQIYNTFVSMKGDPTDLDLFVVDGDLSYEKENQQFILGSAARAYGESYEGNMMAYNEVTTVSKYSGSFNLISSNKDFKLKASGETRARLDSGSFTFDSFLAFDINLPSAAWAQMGEMIADNAGGAAEAVVQSTPLYYKLGEFIGNKAVQNYANLSGGNYVPFPKVSPKLVHSLVFSDVKLKWSKKNNAWYSVGGLGLANVDKKDINSMMGGYIEIKRVGETDNVTVYIETNPTTWYYFNYYENALIVTSSDHKFNQILAPKLKPAGTLALTYTPVQGETIDRNMFVKSFRNSYLGGKGAPLVDAPAPIVDDEPMPEEGMEDGTAKKKKKKNKKGDTATEDGYSDEPPMEEPAITEEPTQEAPAKKKKEKKKKDETTEGDYPAEEPVMEQPPVEEKPKKKKKEKVEEEPPMDEPPMDEEAPAKKKKEKKKKSSEDEEADMDIAP